MGDESTLDDDVRVGFSGNTSEPVRIHIPGRALPDLTDAEGAALYRQLGAYLIRHGDRPITRQNT